MTIVVAIAGSLCESSVKYIHRGASRLVQRSTLCLVWELGGMTHLAGYLLTDVEDTREVWFRF